MRGDGADRLGQVVLGLRGYCKRTVVNTRHAALPLRGSSKVSRRGRRPPGQATSVRSDAAGELRVRELR